MHSSLIRLPCSTIHTKHTQDEMSRLNLNVGFLMHIGNNTSATFEKNVTISWYDLAKTGGSGDVCYDICIALQFITALHVNNVEITNDVEIPNPSSAISSYDRSSCGSLKWRPSRCLVVSNFSVIPFRTIQPVGIQLEVKRQTNWIISIPFRISNGFLSKEYIFVINSELYQFKLVIA